MDFAKIPGAKRSGSIPNIAPELATLTKATPSGDQWLHEIKFDGYRMLVAVAGGKVTFRSRNNLDWTHRFRSLAAAIGELAVESALLDGEVVHILPSGVTSFSALQNDLSEGRTADLHYMAFDLLHADGWDLTGAPLEARKVALAALLEAGTDPRIQYSDHQQGRGPEFFQSACRARLEGIVSKRRDSPYRAGRQAAWLKAKCVLREDLIIVGFTDPAGARAGFGALLVGYHTPRGDLVFGGKVGTGYSTRFLIEFRQRLATLEQERPTVKLPKGYTSRGVHWVRPELVAEVRFTEWTGDGILRHPSFVALREDKSPSEVVLGRAGGT